MHNALNNLKLTVAEVIYDIRRSNWNSASYYFWLRRFRRFRFVKKSNDFSGNPQDLVIAYALTFCLTRKDERTMITGANRKIFADYLAKLGLDLDNYIGLHGAGLKHAANYAEVAEDVFQRLVIHLDRCVGLVPFLYFLRARYVGHRRRDIDMTGFCEHADFTTVSTNEFAVRHDGWIWTFSQQGCQVAAGRKNEKFALGHFQQNRWQAGEVGDLTRSNWSEFIEITGPEGKRYSSIGIGSRQVLAETHAVKDIPLPLGPARIVPTGQFHPIEVRDGVASANSTVDWVETNDIGTN